MGAIIVVLMVGLAIILPFAERYALRRVEIYIISQRGESMEN